jgi:hypothetical protein
MTGPSLLTLFRDGLFGPLRIGASRDAVLEYLGAPSDTSCARSPGTRQPAILKYGDLEFHFGERGGQSLTLIFADDFTGKGGRPAFRSRVSLDTWVVETALTFTQFLAHASAAALAFCPRAHPDPTLTALGTPAGGQIVFITSPETHEPPLVSVALLPPRPNPGVQWTRCARH